MAIFRSLIKRVLHGEAVHVKREDLCHAPEANYQPLFPLSQETIKVMGKQDDKLDRFIDTNPFFYFRF